MLARIFSPGLLAGLAAVAAACSSDSLPSRPCTADTLRCSDPGEICNVQTLQCEPHESCSKTVGSLITVGTCSNPARPRCADLLVAKPATFRPYDLVYEPFCVEPAPAAIRKGAACAVTLFEGVESGRDACADGLTCVDPFGFASGTCMKVCATIEECDSTEVCASFSFTSYSQRRPAYFGSGFCLARCTPFGSDCAGTCVGQYLGPDNPVGACMPRGASALGTECSPSRLAACAAGLACEPISFGIVHEVTCRSLCDAAHPCANSSVCAADSTGYGFCFP